MSSSTALPVAEPGAFTGTTLRARIGRPQHRLRDLPADHLLAVDEIDPTSAISMEVGHCLGRRQVDGASGPVGFVPAATSGGEPR
jgi:hypothetical protein